MPGERGKARRLRSDHAAPGTPTEVQLEATLGGRRMRITRKPEQERRKLRGAGTTTEQAKVLLEEFTAGCWHAVSTRMGEADDEIRDLMGMSADQFFQVVLLPQGEFAKFLHADAGDRAKLLQRLFGTDRFHAVEEWLARRRKATADEIKEAELGISELLARAAQVAGVPVPDDVAQPAAAWAAQLTQAAAAEAAASQAQAAACRRDLDQALDGQRDAARLADRQRRRRDALQTTGSPGPIPPRSRPGPRPATRPAPRQPPPPPNSGKQASSSSRGSATWRRCDRSPGRRPTKTRPPRQPGKPRPRWPNRSTRPGGKPPPSASSAPS